MSKIIVYQLPELSVLMMRAKRAYIEATGRQFPKDLDQAFLARNLINHIRHDHSNYEYVLESAKVQGEPAVRQLKAETMTAIAQACKTYPVLVVECNRQIAVAKKGGWRA